MGGNNKKKHKKKSSTNDDTLLETEDRFDISKPQFRQPKQEEAKVVLDDRFASVLTDPRFQLDTKDKYGRKKKKKDAAKEELSAFYKVQEEEDSRKQDNESEDEEPVQEQQEEDSNDADNNADQNKLQEDPESRISYLTALSRGQVDVSSSSSSDEDDDGGDSDSSDDSDDDDEAEQKVGILDPSAKEEEDEIEITEEESPYLAVMNMDWTHVRAVDVFALLSSFVPMGSIKRVSVFASDFGMERIRKEDQFGPRGLWKKSKVEKADDEDDDDSSAGPNPASDSEGETEFQQSDFDPEKLRAYEASKLKYYFAVVEFSSPEHADKAYKEVDGMEFEHSSAAVDMRAIPVEALDGAIKDRPLRDEAVRVPSNYTPPEFVVTALQQTNVRCSWEEGDRERELTLTKYGQGSKWEGMAESDDIKAYLASDVSSDEEEENEEAGEKGSNLRKMLGLDSDEDDQDETPKAADSQSDQESSSESDMEGDQSKEFTFVPGANSLEDKIRSKLDGKEVKKREEMTPWEKYQEKRRAKRREKRQAERTKRKEVKEMRAGGKPKTEKPERDSFFAHDGDSSEEEEHPTKLSKEELELLVAGDDGDEQTRDYDMRELARLEKNKDKKLRGSRKRKEANRASTVTGTGFQIDTADSRFSAVLDGADDRFGIDRTDPKFKETPAMKQILAEQTRRRKKKRKKSKGDKDSAVKQKPRKDIDADAAMASSNKSGGAAALSALVQSLKSKVQ